MWMDEAAAPTQLKHGQNIFVTRDETRVRIRRPSERLLERCGSPSTSMSLGPSELQEGERLSNIASSHRESYLSTFFCCSSRVDKQYCLLLVLWCWWKKKIKEFLKRSCEKKRRTMTVALILKRMTLFLFAFIFLFPSSS